ncbi:hypothetical protein RZO07_08385 [Pseudomonas protegens]|uniref:Uncharacterized protein n=1 Tax=Pseudomonas idahonensis TaxID=2942628 RepID=A0ABT5QEK8_9PSED|nr:MULTISPECIES: hypothetical protein [Pseudomonas]MBW8357161.1 hypothetical protein [Pseudomonas sp.]MCY7263452.1 hypothetical protein [Pseudomonas protegens]MDC7813967.1 hypothetical protein [Pseudomonas sp. BLCC-B112]MDD1020330.1 hypothetical protein [Pseudomonas idahonensis]MDD1152624.1 hypothetical protein [Pseudomonas idahonensis]
MTRLEPVFDRAREVADLFRLGRDVEAVGGMVELFEPIQLWVDSAPVSVQQDWARLLGLMLACQEMQNWLGLADYLEYEMLDWLQVGLDG